MLEMTQTAKQTVLQYFRQRLRHLLLEIDVEGMELVSIIASISWGAWVINPAWDTFGSSPTFRIIASLAPEPVWGALVLWLGVSQLISLLLDMRRHRVIFNSISCMTWMGMAATFWFTNYQATASVLYPCIAFAGGWASVRVIIMPDKAPPSPYAADPNSDPDAEAWTRRY